MEGSGMRTTETDALSLRGRYLDLLINILTNMIYEDASINPKYFGPFKPEIRSEGRDWPAVAHTMVGLRRLENLRELAQRALDEGVHGDFIETGVWRGGCCILLRGILAANAITDRKVYVADSFEGLPPPNPQAYPHDEGLNLHLHPELAVSLEQVKENFSRYGLLDEQVIFVKGFFQHTLPSLEAGPFALVRLDGDLYESTYVALEALYPRLSPGGFVIVDDYGVARACQAAVSDYRTLMGIDASIQEIDWTGVWWQKPH
jgi:O-methyltransferase/8-demethyl-8-(2,3-dimethoxy-alpha-L-rhamnosyl)tetracenomycin-C 4'-O-methyltransferase